MQQDNTALVNLTLVKTRTIQKRSVDFRNSQYIALSGITAFNFCRKFNTSIANNFLNKRSLDTSDNRV